MKKIFTILMSLFLFTGVFAIDGFAKSSSRSKSYKSSYSKSVKVKSYTKKDGTYVASHTRKAPKSKKSN